jgi:hypothetical protein
MGKMELELLDIENVDGFEQGKVSRNWIIYQQHIVEDFRIQRARHEVPRTQVAARSGVPDLRRSSDDQGVD